MDRQELFRPNNVGRTNEQPKKGQLKSDANSHQEAAKPSAKVVPTAEPGQSTKQKRTAASENVGAEETTAEPPVQITATAFNIDRNESLYEVTYTDLDGRFRKRRIGRELFQDPKKVVDILVKAHAALPDDRASAVADRRRELLWQFVSGVCGAFWYGSVYRKEGSGVFGRTLRWGTFI